MTDNCYIVYKGKNYTQEDFLEYLKSLLPSQTSIDTTSNVEIWKGFWTRKDVENNPDKVFLFGDNFEDAETGYVPSSTQAVIRGLPNAIGISTKNDRGTKKSSYLTDADFNTFKQRVDEQIQKAKESGKTIVIPEDGIGTGKAQLKERAPKLFEYLQQELDKLKNTQPQSVEQSNLIEPGDHFNFENSRTLLQSVVDHPNVESQQVSQPKIDIRAKVYELFNLQGYMDIKTSHKTDKNLITAISHYVLEDLGYKTDQEKLQAVREGFKLSEYITTEQISDVHTRVRLNMKNIIEDEVDDGPVSLGGIKFTSSGYESDAKNAFTCK